MSYKMTDEEREQHLHDLAKQRDKDATVGIKQIAENIITQATAARIRKVSRQRINQLVKDGKLTTPVLPSGETIEGAVYQSEVLNLQEGKRGRPRLPEEEVLARRGHNFHEGESVIWNHKPRDGYGFSILIPASITKLGGKRVCIQFLTPTASDNGRVIKDPLFVKDGNGNICYLETAWVKPDVLLSRLDFIDSTSTEETIGDSRPSENGKHAAEV